MRVPPDDVDPALLADALREHWRIDAHECVYLPAGFGGHHWLVSDRDSRWFVTVDDLRDRMRANTDTLDNCFVRLAGAYAASRELAAAGLGFVVGAEPSVDDAATARLSDVYSLVVHRYLPDARTSDNPTDVELRALIGLLVRVHATSAPSVPRDAFTVPHRAQLLEDLDWGDGPYAARGRALVAEHRAEVAELVAYYESLASTLAARPERMVVTHGEPHSDNVLRTGGGLVLVDWDTVLLAPPERDLWVLADDHADALDSYCEVTGDDLDRNALAFYRLWFDLDEIGGYTRLFRGPHADDANTAVAWGGLVEHLQPRERWPAVFG